LNAGNPIDVLFMKRHMNEMTIPTGTKYAWKLGNFTNSVRFIMLAFKTTAASSYQTNNALITENIGDDRITGLRIQMNNMYYPIDRMQLNFNDYNILELYISYVNLC